MMQTIKSSPYIQPGLVRVKMNMQSVTDILLKELDVTMAILIDKSRKREVIWKRRAAMYLLSWYGFGPSAIGRMFEFDHATVLYTYRSVEYDMLTDQALKEFIRRMQHTKLAKE